MEYKLIFPNQKIIFQETSTGILDIKDIFFEKTIRDSLDGFAFFNFNEIETWAGVGISGSSNSSIMASKNYTFIIRVAKILGYLQEGFYFLAGKWINNEFSNEPLYLNLLKHVLGKDLCRELFFEYTLGQFGENFQENLNTTLLYGEKIDNIDIPAREFYKEKHIINTRVVGFFKHITNFINLENGNEKLIIKKNHEIFVIRDHENKYDANAIQIIYNNGEKIGYIRKTIAKYLAEIMDNGAIYKGTILGTMALHYQPDEMVYVRLEKI